MPCSADIFRLAVSATTIACCRTTRPRPGILEQERRDREHVADVVEAVADVVGGEIGGRLRIDADQVADRVVVLGAVEPADGDAAEVRRLAAVELGEDAFDRRR